MHGSLVSLALAKLLRVEQATLPASPTLKHRWLESLPGTLLFASIKVWHVSRAQEPSLPTERGVLPLTL